MKKHEKINAKSMQILNLEKNHPKHAKKWIWEGLGLNLGGVWDALGRLLAALGRLLLIFVDVLNDVFFKHGSKMDSKTPFGSILGGSWKDLGRIWGGFGKEF